MIEICGLKKSYGKLEVLKDINITINKGEIYGLVGRSGAGKSTLLRCINGLEPYSAGSLKVDGVEINTLNNKNLMEFRKNIGMIFQQFSLLERRNVYENIALPMKCWNYDQKYIDERIKELLEISGISEKIYDRPRSLSGGQKQRVAIARALAMEPKILLCDEATSALDPQTTKTILQLLSKINAKLGLTIIVVTHQMSVVKQVCDKISILEHGQIAATGLVGELFTDRPQALHNLIGKEEYSLPSGGSNIKIILSSQESYTNIISDLARNLDIDVSLVGGKIEQIRNGSIGELIINIPTAAFNKVIEYFEHNKIKWLIPINEINSNEDENHL